MATRCPRFCAALAAVTQTVTGSGAGPFSPWRATVPNPAPLFGGHNAILRPVHTLSRAASPRRAGAALSS
jgi:hypothetical protein